jgi:hypothetical protein
MLVFLHPWLLSRSLKTLTTAVITTPGRSQPDLAPRFVIAGAVAGHRVFARGESCGSDAALTGALAVACSRRRSAPQAAECRHD